MMKHNVKNNEHNEKMMNHYVKNNENNEKIMKDYVKNNENNEKIMKGYVKNNVLKQFNNFKNYRYDFFIFSIFRFSIMFPVVVPRCSAPL